MMMEPLTLAILFMAIPIMLTLIQHARTRKRTGIPEPPGAWPFIGHLPLLAGKTTPPHQILAGMSDKHGPVFSIWLGTKPTVVVSGVDAIKECFTVIDHVTASRPDCSLGRIMGHGNACFGLAPYGPYWRKLRKVCVSELLSFSKIEMFTPIRTSEVGDFIKELYTHSSVSPLPVNMAQWFCHLIINIILKMVAGKRYPYEGGDGEGKRVVQVVREFMTAAGLTVVSDMVQIPMIQEWLDWQGNIKAMKRATGNLDHIVDQWIDEHQAARTTAHGDGDGDKDFIDSLLSQVGQGELNFDEYKFKTRTTIISTVEAIFLAATDSTCAALIWAVSELINQPKLMEQAQEELDRVIGSERWVEESDIANLPLLVAIMKENLRLHPPAPMAAPHEASEDCMISGYTVPKGTQLFFNIWKLQRDPEVWEDPDQFKPERFLSGPLAGADVRSGKYYEIIPFGSGRRICPAPETAMRMLHLTLARLLQGFRVATPDGKPVDMTEGPGIIAPTATPLRILLEPRLPHAMYL